MKNRFRILFLFCAAFASWQCERDDICPENTGSTPLLILKFSDYNDPENLKDAPSLTIKAISEEGNFISYTTVDSIAIPLKIFENYTEYEFTINDMDPDDQDEEEEENPDPNTDIVTFSYTTEEVYLNRACGYIVNYQMNNAVVQPENPNNRWIRQITILQPEVANETNAHINILH